MPVIVKKAVKIFQPFSSKLMEEALATYLSPRHGKGSAASSCWR